MKGLFNGEQYSYEIGGADFFLDFFNQYNLTSSGIEEDLVLLKIT